MPSFSLIVRDSIQSVHLHFCWIFGSFLLCSLAHNGGLASQEKPSSMSTAVEAGLFCRFRQTLVVIEIMQAVPFILHAYTMPCWTCERINFYYYQQPIETFNEAISKWAKSLSWSDLFFFLFSGRPIQHAIRQAGCYSIFIMIWKDFSFCTLGSLVRTYTSHFARGVRSARPNAKRREKKAKSEKVKEEKKIKRK